MKTFEVKTDLIDNGLINKKVFRISMTMKGIGSHPLDNRPIPIGGLIWMWNDNDIIEKSKRLDKYQLVDRYKYEFKKTNATNIEKIELFSGFERTQEMISMINNHIETTVLNLVG